ncbi:flagellar filament capping protein FliD [Helicobacter brantae]|uniref:Flagellar hook-associated protein 2 n=1 Tax=Helicobacter brantae TaxID=375927 RepID=A0A3D8J135_9HELI|nr:flagellar filament capping protein FliD [Helicobacter brantae]RDU71188.1 flagellar filament capping protein FliD [Helicobacter brantae]
MAMGKLSSLGVGSNVLNYDVIEKLKKADEKAMIEPIDKKMKDNIEKQAELSGIIGMLNGMRGSAQTLSDYSTYIGRKVNVLGDALRATANPGVPIQDISIDIKQIAKNDINEVGTRFEDRSSVFCEQDTNLSFYVRGQRYKIEIKAGTTLGEVAQLITDKSGGTAIGVVMKTGGANPYQLMINSKETGEENKIYFGSTLQSDTIASGSLELTEGDLELVLKDAKGLDQSVNIILPPTEANSKSSDNAQALKKAIKEAIGENPDLADLLGSDINIGIGVGGNTLVINDRRGYQVQVYGSKAKTIGFKQTETPEENLVTSSKVTTTGRMSGNITINGVPLDLSEITERGNSAEQNAQAIAQGLDNVSDLHAYVSKDGKIVINSDDGEVRINAQDEAGREALKKLGLQEGTFAGYSKTQEQTLRLKNIQSGQDAEITYNGVTITRGKNTINDIVGGVSLELVSTTPEGNPATVSITADNENIIEDIKGFVEKYNELMPKLAEVTRYDPDTQTAGIFNGVSFIRMIRSSINKIFSMSSGSGLEIQSLIKYGLSLDDNNKMSFDESKLRNALNSDADAVRDFFIGIDKTILGKDTRVGGVFRVLNEDLDSLVKGSNSTLKLYEQSLTRDDKRLREDRKRTMERLNARYESMAERFAAYDAQIAQTNNSFNSVQMMINQATKGK